MSKFATKAADSPFYLARMEASKVNDRLASREGAADETGIDRSRMARVELGSANPTPEEVLLLADTYDAPQLLNYYCSMCCPIGRQNVKPCSRAGVRPRYDAGTCRLAGHRQKSAPLLFPLPRTAAWTPARMCRWARSWRT